MARPDDDSRDVLLGGLPEDEKTLNRYRSALYSAAYHAHAEDHHRNAPYAFRPMGLDEVMHTFEARPHGVLQEHVAAWLLDHPRRAPEFHAHVDRLVGSDAREAAVDAMEQRSDGRWRSISWGNSPPRRAEASRFSIARESLRRSRLETHGSSGSADAKRSTPLYGHNTVGAAAVSAPNFSCRVHFDFKSQVTSVQATVHCDRPPQAFNVLADPQNWSRAAGLFFLRSQLVDIRDGKIEDIASVPPGQRNYRASLEEVVSLSFNPLIPMLGRNVLRVDYKRADRPNDPCYSLVDLRMCVSTVIGASATAGGLDVDSGSFRAEKVNGTTRLTGSKIARFTERELWGWKFGAWLNLFAPLWIGPWLGLLMFEAAFAN